MTEFIDEDFSDGRLERVNFTGAKFDRVKFNDAQMHSINFSGIDVRGAIFNGMRIRSADLIDVNIHGEVQNFVVNGVDIAPLVDAELNRQMPERAKMRPTDPAGYADAWSTLETLWAGTVDRARRLPDRMLHQSVNGEWSFVQTLRHLNFASAAWVGRQLGGNPAPYDDLDLPWDECPDIDGIPHDREARPSLDQVLAIRAKRQTMVREVIAKLTEADLASNVSMTEPGWPDEADMPLKDCLLTVINEEWEHRLFAERDLAVLESEA